MRRGGFGLYHLHKKERCWPFQKGIAAKMRMKRTIPPVLKRQVYGYHL